MEMIAIFKWRNKRITNILSHTSIKLIATNDC